MRLGFNTNVPYRGKLYHVQTEDSGIKNPVIVTLLYYQGAILASKKLNYSRLLGDPDWQRKLEEMMKLQHKLMIKELVAGKHTEEKPEEKGPEEGVKVTTDAEWEKGSVKVAKEKKETLDPAPETKNADCGEVVPPEPDKSEVSKSSKHKKKKAQLNDSLDDILLDHIIKRFG
jgi:hypothetical protein